MEPERLSEFPESPGVYILKDADGNVIYVGKANAIRTRLRQHFAARNTVPKERVLCEKTRDIECIVVQNEIEALMLECTLIKQHRPRYNILLKDDKNFYPYIRIDMREDFPRVEVVRSAKKDGAKYFGPFAAANAIREALEVVNANFPLRTCKKDIARAIARKERPCLKYQIGRCMGPCTGGVTKEDYAAAVRRVEQFLLGKYAGLVRELRAKMAEAAERLDFEQAARLRDGIAAVELVQEKQAVSSAKDGNMDAFALVAGEAPVVQGVFVRKGHIVGSEAFYMENAEGEGEGVLEQFLTQYYDTAPVPPEVLLESEIAGAEAICEYLRAKRKKNVKVIVPKRGRKREIVKLARANAEQSQKSLLNKKRREWERHEGALDMLARELGLENPPRRIEAFDISNIQGTDSVASMVVFTDGRPDRKQYRRFKIKTVEGANDFASMREVVFRRFTRGVKEAAEREEQGLGKAEGGFAAMPDLVLIDGGRGQLSFAMEALAVSGAGDIPMIGLAKRLEEIILPYSEEPLILDRSSPALFLLQRVRDEAHRFAITYHRSARADRTLVSELDGIPGIGKKRRNALLKKYPSVAHIKKLTKEELAQVEGMNLAAAEAVYRHFHGDGE